MKLKEILKTVTVENNTAKLPDIQLDRKDYNEYKKFMEKIRGKYSTSDKSYHFNYNPSAPINAYLNTGIMPDKNPTAYFPTPKAIIDEMFDSVCTHIEYNSPIRKTRVLEPSAGGGAIADALMEKYPHIQLDTVEFLKENQDVLKDKGCNPFCGSFLDFEAEPYDYIFMNPPFSVKGDSNAFMTHIYHAFELLRNDGEIIAIVPTGFIQKSSKKDSAFRDFLGKYCMEIRQFKQGAFKESGTMVETLLLKIVKTEWRQKEHQDYINFHVWNFAVCQDGEYNKKLNNKFIEKDNEKIDVTLSNEEVATYQVEKLMTPNDEKNKYGGNKELLTFLPMEYFNLYVEQVKYERQELMNDGQFNYKTKEKVEPKKDTQPELGGLFDF